MPAMTFQADAERWRSAPFRERGHESAEENVIHLGAVCLRNLPQDALGAAGIQAHHDGARIAAGVRIPIVRKIGGNPQDGGRER